MPGIKMGVYPNCLAKHKQVADIYSNCLAKHKQVADIYPNCLAKHKHTSCYKKIVFLLFIFNNLNLKQIYYYLLTTYLALFNKNAYNLLTPT